MILYIMIRFCNFTPNTSRLALKTNFGIFYSHWGVAEDKENGSDKPNVFGVLMNVQRSYNTQPPSSYTRGYILNLENEFAHKIFIVYNGW